MKKFVYDDEDRQVVRCTTCGWAILLEEDAPETDRCFCCQRQIPLFQKEGPDGTPRD